MGIFDLFKKHRKPVEEALTDVPTNNLEQGGQAEKAITEGSSSEEQASPKSTMTQEKMTEGNTSKTKKAKVYNLIIVDESGSMSHLRQATLSGINETISTIRSAQKEFAETQSHFLTLVTFDSGSNREDVRTVINRAPITQVSDFNDYQPNGCTPLYDAMGESLTNLEKYVSNDSSASVVVTVLTDGLENASREWTAPLLRRLIERLKEKGWSFAYMGSAHNVKEVTDLLSIDNVMEFSHNQTGACDTWRRERGAKFHYFSKLNRMMADADDFSQEELAARKCQMAREYYNPRVTPSRVTSLAENEVFVFGSNKEGFHSGGASAIAMQRFGAVWGQSEGLQGRSYAIPTVAELSEVKAAVERFTEFAKQNPESRFLVTAVGCSSVGYSPYQIAPLFRECIKLENVALPAEFWKELGLNVDY